MSGEPAPRTNEAWLEALRDPSPAGAAVAGELHAYLSRVIGRMVGGRLGDDVRDLVQESLVRIVASLDSFRGDSAFTTWAAGVATRVAFTELRRRSVRERREDEFGAAEQEVRELPSPSTPAPGDAAARTDLLAGLERAIRTRLTERQRAAILAELRGVPTIEIAERLGTNQNALYKLTHDARAKLRTALLEMGFTADSLHAASTEVPR